MLLILSWLQMVAQDKRLQNWRAMTELTLSKQKIAQSGDDKWNIGFDNSINNNFASYKTLNY